MPIKGEFECNTGFKDVTGFGLTRWGKVRLTKKEIILEGRQSRSTAKWFLNLSQLGTILSGFIVFGGIGWTYVLLTPPGPNDCIGGVIFGSLIAGILTAVACNFYCWTRHAVISFPLSAVTLLDAKAEDHQDVTAFLVYATDAGDVRVTLQCCDEEFVNEFNTRRMMLLSKRK